jgi:hypothetical protein
LVLGIIGLVLSLSYLVINEGCDPGYQNEWGGHDQIDDGEEEEEEPPPPLEPDPNIITLTYNWYYNNQRYTWSVEVPRELAQYYYQKDRPTDRPSGYHYADYVTEQKGDLIMRKLVDDLFLFYVNETWGEENLVEFTISFVQSLEYYEEYNEDYPRYPIQTLVDYGGDCEDTSIL